jgi:hypothetical protein
MRAVLGVRPSLPDGETACTRASGLPVLNSDPALPCALKGLQEHARKQRMKFAGGKFWSWWAKSITGADGPVTADQLWTLTGDPMRSLGRFNPAVFSEDEAGGPAGVGVLLAGPEGGLKREATAPTVRWLSMPLHHQAWLDFQMLLGRTPLHLVHCHWPNHRYSHLLQMLQAI